MYRKSSSGSKRVQVNERIATTTKKSNIKYQRKSILQPLPHFLRARQPKQPQELREVETEHETTGGWSSPREKQNKKGGRTCAHVRVFFEEAQDSRQHGNDQKNLHQPILELFQDHAKQRLIVVPMTPNEECSLVPPPQTPKEQRSPERTRCTAVNTRARAQEGEIINKHWCTCVGVYHVMPWNSLGGARKGHSLSPSR